jgi:hypothetical protein
MLINGKDQRYLFYKIVVEYNGIEQKKVVCHSTEMQKKDINSLNNYIRMVIPMISIREKGNRGKLKKNKKLIFHYVVSPKAVRDEEITINGKKYHGKFIV